MKLLIQIVLAVTFVFCCPQIFLCQTINPLERTNALVKEVINQSYPELKQTDIAVKTFDSDSDYFRAQFSIPRFMTFRKMKYVVLVNPKIYQTSISETAMKAILAHELSHVLYYQNKNRFELLGLVNLLDGGFTQKFERKADLEAIARNYGVGLTEYRLWLYQNIPAKNIAEKKRNYFTPEEIDLMLLKLKSNPNLINVWRKKVPKNFEEISKSN